MSNCPLCDASETVLLHESTSREFYQCVVCDLIFVPERFFLSAQAELAHYGTHHNSPDDLNYRKFLSKLAEPMLARIDSGGSGLDFGSGPGPTLSVMFEEAGHQMELYDCFYADQPEVFDKHYDFITATEVFEHLHHPQREITRLLQSLKPNGHLGVMTMQPPVLNEFENWHYIKDPTHVCFYSQKTFRWIAERWNVECELPARDVVIFQTRMPD